MATAIRTGVVLVMAWLIVLIKGKRKDLKEIDKKELSFIALSGLATGASSLCYYYTIQNGIVNIIKMSTAARMQGSGLQFRPY